MDFKEEFDYKLNILLMGDIDVGKSTIRVRYAEVVFVSRFDFCSIDAFLDFNIITREIDNLVYKLFIWDTFKRSERYVDPEQTLRGITFMNGILLIYDITNRESFESITNIW